MRHVYTRATKNPVITIFELVKNISNTYEGLPKISVISFLYLFLIDFYSNVAVVVASLFLRFFAHNSPTGIIKESHNTLAPLYYEQKLLYLAVTIR